MEDIMSYAAARAGKLKGLQEEFADSVEKLAALDKACVLEVDPTKQVTLKKQIKEEERRQEDLKGKMAILPLGDALLQLDFTDHSIRFTNTIDRLGDHAFLVRPSESCHDESQDSIRLLVKRLLTHFPDHISTSPIKIGLKSNVRKSDATALWRELAKKVGSSWNEPSQGTGSNEPKREVANRVAQRLCTQNVVLLVTDLDRVDPAVCMRDFWVPLAEAAQRAPSRDYRLVLLLVDYAGETGLPKPHAPLRAVELPRVLPFSIAALTAWIKHVYYHIPSNARPKASYPVKALLQELIPADPANGPDFVLRRISEIWGCPMEVLDAWLEV